MPKIGVRLYDRDILTTRAAFMRAKLQIMLLCVYNSRVNVHVNEH